MALLKVLHINTERTWRGGERQTLYSIQGLLEAGCTVELLCRKDFPLAKEAKKARVTVHEVEKNGAFNWLQKNGSAYDILHAQSSGGQTAAVLSKHFHKRPVVYTRRVDFRVKGALSKWKYRNTDKLVAISGAIRNIMLEQGFRDIDVIPSVVKASQLDRSRAESVLAEKGLTGKRIVATVAAMVPHKDPLTMVKAIAELRALRQDFAFLHFGDGELQPVLKDKVNELGLSDHYHFMGHVSDVEDFYSVFDVFVMSSEEEGLGSSLLDAFQYRVPVASTNAGGLKETVEGRGLLSDIKDHKALAGNIYRLLGDPSLAAELINKAKTDVAAHYGIAGATKRYLEVYRSLMVNG